METTGEAEPEWRPQELAEPEWRPQELAEPEWRPQELAEPEWRPQELVEPGGVGRQLSRDCSTQVKITLSWKWIQSWTTKTLRVKQRGWVIANPSGTRAWCRLRAGTTAL